MLRSIATQCVSKHEAAPTGATSSFETRSFGSLLRMRIYPFSISANISLAILIESSIAGAPA